MKRKTYYEQLQDPRWQKKAAQIKEDRGWKCEICNDDTKQLSVHHTFYNRDTLIWDYPDWSLKCLCKSCHGEAQSEMESAHEFIAKHDFFFFLASLSNLSDEEASILNRLLVSIVFDCGSRARMLQTLESVASSMSSHYLEGVENKKP